MSELFDVKDVDRRFYREKLQSFLPDRIIDVHTHVWLKNFRQAPPTGRAVRGAWRRFLSQTWVGTSMIPSGRKLWSFSR